MDRYSESETLFNLKTGKRYIDTGNPPLSCRTISTMACATQLFQQITQARFSCLLQKASNAGIAINGNEGEASKDGITLRWKFDPVSQTLELQCLDLPFFLSCGDVNGKIHDLVDSCP